MQRAPGRSRTEWVKQTELHTILGFRRKCRSIYNFRIKIGSKIVFSLEIIRWQDITTVTVLERHYEINSCGAESQLSCTGAVKRATFSSLKSAVHKFLTICHFFFSFFQYFFSKKKKPNSRKMMEMEWETWPSSFRTFVTVS